MINRNKLEHILEYAKQQRYIGQSCKVPPEDMVEIMERLLSACNSPAIPDGYVMVPVEPTKEILDEFDSIIDYGAEDSVDAWHRLLAAAPQSPGSEPAKDDRDHQLCRRCNDGIRGGCSSCAYNVR
ncbi:MULTISPECIES: hypothetical protein [Enterobacteriaceae]|jgi:hypothetical protein|uniref:hypothetical protein n=1 Tax=Enterobacteriaceae TaxID=543 RepID=UPI0001DC5D67|nr:MULTISPECIES: hypothetical protein [Enterobacteriaceae]HBQ5690710.1 hypothetical protein [Klebsiella pneumoniae subsp. pneumoniae]EFK14687.1 hypothetical protein HMPREF9541_02931 [Escherichia coli MS 116-1]EKV8696688.1 hypothetical protein [Klebsiella pneumoniae]EMC8498549.1 hypothetical protein [Klebsiella pneumoniae]MCE0321140.1 hypothetical protein [Klebsiella pneumoniae]